MPQSPFGGPQPLGVIYNTSMSRPDAALALAELYGFQGKRESRMGSVCVVGAGLRTAMFCDIVKTFFQPGPPRNANQSLPIGLADVQPLPPDSPMVLGPLARQKGDGSPEYGTTIHKVTDTSVAEAVLRNGVIFNAEAAVILSAPATYLAKSLDLLGVKDIYRERVKRLVIVDAGSPHEDVPALRRILAEWPAPVFYCGKEVGDALPFPGACVEKDFAWSEAHPIVDAYRAFQPMPYDAPSYDLAAAHFAVHPDSGFFQLSDAGTLAVADNGRLKFTPGGGAVRSLSVDASKKAEIIQAFVALTSAKPVQPQRFQRPAGDQKKADTAPKK